MAANKLKLNDDKTEVLLVKTKQRKIPDTAPQKLRIGNASISFSKSARNLGVTITSDLSMDDHVNSICRSAYFELRRISTIRHLLTFEAAKTLVCSLVLSRLDYCNALLVDVPETLIDKLQKVQNSAARVIFKIRRREHITPYLKQLHWLPITARIKYKISSLCFRSLTDPQFPTYLSDLLLVYDPNRQLRSTSDNRALRVPKTRRVRSGDRSFCHSAPMVWNSLPHEVRHAATLPSFKRSLKTHLFREAYESV